MMMLVPILIAVLKMLLLSPASTTKPVKFGTMKLSFTPGSALVINEGESQIFRYSFSVVFIYCYHIYLFIQHELKERLDTSVHRASLLNT